MGSHLDLAPAVLAVLVLGVLTRRRGRTRLGVAHPGWPWSVAPAVLGAIGATDVFGSLEIHRWLATSVSRTTLFDQVAVLTDMTVWALVALSDAGRPVRREPAAAAALAPATVTARVGAPVDVGTT